MRGLESVSKVLSSKRGSTDAKCIINSTRPLLMVQMRAKDLLYVEALKRYLTETKVALAMMRTIR